MVFYITDNGVHGLEVAPSNWSTEPTGQWSNITDTLVVSTKLPADIGTGHANTLAIINQLGHTASAAQKCRAYTGGGKTDWFLPSLGELTVLAQNKPASWVYDDASSYWSSTEYSLTRPYCVIMSSGESMNTYGKGFSTNLIRPVRAF